MYATIKLISFLAVLAGLVARIQSCNSYAGTQPIEVLESGKIRTQETDIRSLMYGAIQTKDSIWLYYDDSNEKLNPYFASLTDSIRLSRSPKQLISQPFSAVSHIPSEQVKVIMGDLNSLHDDAWLNHLPVQFDEAGFGVGEYAFSIENSICFISFYPDPVSNFPMYILHGSPENIKEFLSTAAEGGWRRLFRNQWGYQVFQNGEVALVGNFTAEYDQVDVTMQRYFEDHHIIIEDDLIQITYADKKYADEYRAKQIKQRLIRDIRKVENWTGKPLQVERITCRVYGTIEEKGIRVKSTSPISMGLQENEFCIVNNGSFDGLDWGDHHCFLLKGVLGDPNLPFLEEGIAVLLSEQWGNFGVDYWVSRLIHSDNLNDIVKICLHPNFRESSPWIRRIASAGVVKYLIEQHGKDWLLKNYLDLSYDHFSSLDENEVIDRVKTLFPPQTVRSFGTKQLRKQFARGFNFAHENYDIYNGYGSQQANESIIRLAELNVNALAIVPYSYMRNANLPSALPLMFDPGSENDETVIYSHLRAQEQGMYTLLKPQIWLGRSWPGDIRMENNEDWNRFFKYYYDWIRHYALIAEMFNFDGLCLGVELVHTTLERPDDWRNLIKHIRDFYSGELTYAANWGDEFEQFEIADHLDYVGLNCYYPLSTNPEATYRELDKNFKSIVQKIKKVQSRLDKPVCLTEVGFRSVKSPWLNPHEGANDRELDQEHQKMCYQVVLDNFKDESAWMIGYFWWKWPSYLAYRGRNNASFTPNRKLAEEVITDYFSAQN